MGKTHSTEIPLGEGYVSTNTQDGLSVYGCVGAGYCNDTDGDGKVNNWDLVQIIRALNGWDI